MSGPSHAEEVSRAIPTTCVVGASTKETAVMIQDIFMSENFLEDLHPEDLLNLFYLYLMPQPHGTT